MKNAKINGVFMGNLDVRPVADVACRPIAGDVDYPNQECFYVKFGDLGLLVTAGQLDRIQEHVWGSTIARQQQNGGAQPAAASSPAVSPGGWGGPHPTRSGPGINITDVVNTLTPDQLTELQAAISRRMIQQYKRGTTENQGQAVANAAGFSPGNVNQTALQPA